MSTRDDKNELIEALKKIPAEQRQQRLAEFLSAVKNDPLVKINLDKRFFDRLPLNKSLFTRAVPERRLTELRGLGGEVWRAVDAQGYVNSERESWES